MQCPQCNEAMRSVNQNGILLDMCPNCRGVWLAAPDLERFMRGMAPAGGYIQDPRYRQDRDLDHDDGRHDRYNDPRSRRHGSDDSDDGYRTHGGHGHKRGFLNRLFQMFD